MSSPFTEHIHGMVDLLDKVLYPGGEQDRFSFRPGMAEQCIICQRSRGDLVTGNRKLLDEIHGRLVPARCKPR